MASGNPSPDHSERRKFALTDEDRFQLAALNYSWPQHNIPLNPSQKVDEENTRSLGRNTTTFTQEVGTNNNDGWSSELGTQSPVNENNLYEPVPDDENTQLTGSWSQQGDGSSAARGRTPFTDTLLGIQSNIGWLVGRKSDNDGNHNASSEFRDLQGNSIVEDSNNVDLWDIYDDPPETKPNSVDPWSTKIAEDPVDKRRAVFLPGGGDDLGYSNNSLGGDLAEKASKISLPLSEEPNNDEESLSLDRRSPDVKENELAEEIAECVQDTDELSPSGSDKNYNALIAPNAVPSSNEKLERNTSELKLTADDDKSTHRVNEPHIKVWSECVPSQVTSSTSTPVHTDENNLSPTLQASANIPQDLARLVISDAAAVDSKPSTPDIEEPSHKEPQIPVQQSDDPEFQFAYRASISQKLANIAQDHSLLEYADPRQDFDYWRTVVEDLRKRTSRAYRQHRNPEANSTDYVLEAFSQSLLQAASLKTLIDDEEGSEMKLLQNAAVFRKCAAIMEQMAHGTGHSRPESVSKDADKLRNEANRLEEMVKYLPSIRESLGDDFIDILVMYRLFEGSPSLNPAPHQMTFASEIWRRETTEEEKGDLVRVAILQDILPILPDAVYQ